MDHFSQLSIDDGTYAIVDLYKTFPPPKLRRQPYSIRLLIESVARCSQESMESVLARATDQGPDCEVPFKPNRLMFHDATCQPALADSAGMRDLVAELGGDPQRMTPMIPAVLTISTATGSPVCMVFSA